MAAMVEEADAAAKETSPTTDASAATTASSVTGSTVVDAESPFAQYITETPAETAIVEQLIVAVEAHPEWATKRDDFAPTRMSYLRFVRGNKMVLEKSVEDYTKALIFRREMEVHLIDNLSYPGITAKEHQSIQLSGKDVDGRPIVEVFAKVHMKNDRCIDEYKRKVVHIFETCMANKNDERLCFIFHMESFSVFKAYVVDAPFVFNACWTVIKPWLDPVTASKVTFLKSKDLAKHITIAEKMSC